MKWVQTAWLLARDVALTGAGLWLIISQIGARDPSSALIVAGLALVVPSAATHAHAVLSGPSPEAGHGPPPSSPSASPPASSPSTPPAARGDGGAG